MPCKRLSKILPIIIWFIRDYLFFETAIQKALHSI
jgi:hypothetical protein